ncbi:ABC transporter permease [candidate division KSB1 bacterium]|nr:ABC transporter permease [candidate division KSB1 bacterium]
MNKRFIAIIRKEFIHILRDPRSLLITFVMPLLMIFLFGNAVELDIKEIPFGVIDQDNSQASRELIDKFINSGYFKLQPIEQNREHIHDLFMQRAVKAVLIIPVDYAKDLQIKPQVQAQMIVDGSNSNTASVIINYTKMIFATLTTELNVQTINMPLEIESRVWYNPDMESANFVVPGLVAIIMMMICALLTSITIVREKETGTMEQILVSPIKPYEVVFGKVLPYVIIAFFDGVLVLVFAWLSFGVPIAGNVLLLAVLSLFYLYASLSLGVFISTQAKTQLVAMMAALVITVLPSVMLSGFIFPIRSMPNVLQWLTYIVPARYFLVIIRGIVLKGVGFQYFWTQTLFLFVLGTILLTISTRKFSTKLE